MFYTSILHAVSDISNTLCFHAANLEVMVVSNVSMNEANIGDTVVLSCNISSSSDVSDALFTWTHVDSGETLDEESSILILSEISLDQFGTYHCDVNSDNETASANITITQGKYMSDIQSRLMPLPQGGMYAFII